MSADWFTVWQRALGFADDAPRWVVAAIALMGTFTLVIVPSGAALAYLDRKMGAHLQARVGPNRAGPRGLLQPLADLLKLLQKEAPESWSWREAVWLSVQTMALYSTLAVLPLGSLALMVDTDMSVFLPFWAALVLALSTLLMGLSQRSVPGWFGGVRSAAQALAGAFPALISLLCVGLRAGSFRWSALVAAQGASPFSWAAFANPPFELVAFLVFMISGLVLFGVPPMDGATSPPDIHGGVVARLHGRRLSLYRLGRFYGFFLWSVITVVLFLGAWSLPQPLVDSLRDAEDLRLVQAGELVWLLAKTFTLMLVVIWVARVNPRRRIDQVTDFAWKVLSPFSLAALIGVGLWVGWRAL